LLAHLVRQMVDKDWHPLPDDRDVLVNRFRSVSEMQNGGAVVEINSVLVDHDTPPN
jgi:hypothetical protein